MGNLFKIALRNLSRYKRRSLLTTSLIAFGVIFVLVFVSVSGSFKRLMITQITDSYLGDFQVHRRGYVASIETLPLNLNLNPKQPLLSKRSYSKIPRLLLIRNGSSSGRYSATLRKRRIFGLTAFIPTKSLPPVRNY